MLDKLNNVFAVMISFLCVLFVVAAFFNIIGMIDWELWAVCLPMVLAAFLYIVGMAINAVAYLAGKVKERK